MKIYSVFLILIFCMGCGQQGSKPGAQEIVYDPLPNNNHNGTGDGGGGHGVDGKALESFARNPKKELAKCPELSQIINALAAVDIPLAADFLHIMQERVWYFVNAPVGNIPSAQIGVNFPTEEYAIQTGLEIYFNTSFVDKMEPDERGILFLHELLMGVRIMEWQTNYDRCLAVAAQDLFFPQSPQHDYASKRSQCFKDYGLASKLQVVILNGKLTPSEYEKVRFFTNYLRREIAHLDGNDLEERMKAMHFRFRE